jgi:hypothetical protein
MKKGATLRFLTMLVVVGWVPGLAQRSLALASQGSTAAQAKPAEIRISNASIPTRVLVQSPAETDTELQIICLFRSDPSNILHGSLIEANEKLRGLLDQIRKPPLFRGELGETILIIPPAGGLAAKKLLIVGLGDSQTFTPQRMELVGSGAYRESNRLGIAHPISAPTIVHGGVTSTPPGRQREGSSLGFLRAARTEKVLKDAGGSPGQVIQDLTYLAGAAHAADTEHGIEKAFAAEAGN